MATKKIQILDTIVAPPDPTVVQYKEQLVTTIDATSTDEQYPSAKAVYDLVGDCDTVIASINTLVGGDTV